MPQRPLLAMRNLIQRHFDTTVAIACISSFLGYFWLCCFKTEWGGDIHLYIAAVHSLYDGFWDPMHETLPISGRYSNFYSPYLVAVGGFGKLLGLSGYRVLQWAGVFNITFYVAAIFCFFRNHSLFKRSWLPPALFIVVSTLLQNQYFHWSSEMTFRSLMSIQAYPSMFGWAVGITCLGLAARFLAGGRLWSGLAVAFLVWLVLLSHPLTATWVVGIVGLQGIITLVQRRWGALRRVGGLYGFVLAGVAIAPFWPYMDLIAVASSTGVDHHPPFEGHPFRWMLWLYILSIPCALYFVRIRRHGFVILGFAATFLAYYVSQLLGIGYGNRYIIFQAFFAQVIIAEAAAIGPLLLLGCAKARQLRQPATGRLVFVIFTLVVIAASLYSPAVRKLTSMKILQSPIALLRQPSFHDAYYHQLDDVREFLRPGDIVMAPNRSLNADLPPVTGARPVVAPAAFRAPDYEGRLRDTEVFFASETTKMQRDAILAKYNANRILLGPWDLQLVERIERDYGVPVVRSESFVLFFSKDASGNGGGRQPS